MKQNTAEEDGIHNSVAGSPVSITCNDDPGEVSGSTFPQGWVTYTEQNIRAKP